MTNFNFNTSIYLQIADRICDEILENRYPPGERIPSMREYAAMVEVNANTVVRSYEWLQMQGIIYNKRGIGYFVETDGIERIKALRRDKFFKEQLPAFFKQLYQLNITIDEIDIRYAEYLQNKTDENR